jgi:hypothetical protein
MQGQKQFTDKVVVRFRLSERVPWHNLYRRLEEVLDLRFLYEETQALYSHTGQPSLDPVVFFKLLLVGRLENISSDLGWLSTARCGWIFCSFWATSWTRSCLGTRP